jgi:hypothetical protein
MIWPDIVAVSRPFFFSGLGVIPKVFRINDALYRPQYFVFEALLKERPIVIGGVTSRGPDPVIKYEDQAELGYQQ